ncbi:MAG: hypothetical protein ACTS6A_01375 [Candidatus Hodgkinia cicadicola]
MHAKLNGAAFVPSAARSKETNMSLRAWKSFATCETLLRKGDCVGCCGRRSWTLFVAPAARVVVKMIDAYFGKVCRFEG